MTDDVPQPTPTQPPAGRVPPSIEELCRRFDNDDAHTYFVAELATHLFHLTRDIHALPDSTLPVLQAAAKLHNIGLYFGQAKHHLNGRNLILEQGVAGFDADEVRMIALGTAFHRKKVREDSDSIYQELPAIKQLHALRIAAIVRVADGLDYTQDQSAEPTYFDGTRKRGRLFVKGEGSEVNVARANEKADLWGRAMPRPLAFTVDKGFQYYLRRGDRMQAAAYKLFRRFYDEAMTHEDGVRAGADVEELHDFRVAIRRLRASMKAFQPSLGGELLKPIRDELRFIQQETNAARDLDVLIEALKELPSSEGATTLLEQIRNDRQRAREAVESLLNGVTYRHFKANFPVFLEETLHPVAHPLDEKAASKRARNVAPELLTTLLSEVLSYRDALATGDDEEAMHALRIACKRFRYAADFFGELLNTEHGFLIDQLKAMQDSLGDLRDADVRGAYFEAFDREHRNRFAKEEQRSLAAIFEGRACDLPEEEERALLSLIDENRAQRRNALDTFHTQWRVFASDEFQQRIAGTFKINLESMPATTTE